MKHRLDFTASAMRKGVSMENSALQMTSERVAVSVESVRELMESV